MGWKERSETNLSQAHLQVVQRSGRVGGLSSQLRFAPVGGALGRRVIGEDPAPSFSRRGSGRGTASGCREELLQSQGSTRARKEEGEKKRQTVDLHPPPVHLIHHTLRLVVQLPQRPLIHLVRSHELRPVRFEGSDDGLRVLVLLLEQLPDPRAVERVPLLEEVVPDRRTRARDDALNVERRVREEEDFEGRGRDATGEIGRGEGRGKTVGRVVLSYIAPEEGEGEARERRRLPEG